jgi:lambda family phage portal protein
VGWNAPTTSPNQGVLQSITTLRDRSRNAGRNDGYAAGILAKLTNNIVGTGIKPLSQATDLSFREDVQNLWAKWTAQSDARGVSPWEGQMSQAVRCWLEAGEVFIRLRQRRPEDGLAVPLQVEVVEPELCPVNYNIIAGTGNRVRAGIEFDPIGRRVAYYFFYSRPGDLMDFDPGDLRRVPADSVLHVYKPLRAGQLRGIPHLTSALIRLRELDKFDDATLLRQQLANMFVAFLKHPSTNESSVIPITGGASSPTSVPEGDRPILSLAPGIFQELDAGEEVEFSKPPDIVQGYEGFIKQQLRAACAAADVPYEVLTSDLSGVNDRSMRVILNEFRRGVQAMQHQVVAHQLCNPVWSAWMDAAFLAQALPFGNDYLVDPTPYSKVIWTPQAWTYIHPVQDVQAGKEAVRNGFASRASIVSELGEDPQAVDAQQAADNARADALGLKFDSDGRQPANGAAVPGANAPGAPVGGE